jgi:flagellar motor switch protein FliG
MMDFDDFGGPLTGKPLSQADKAAAVLLAMGKGVAGKLLKYFTQAELQTIIASAQTLRTIPPDELTELVNEFEDLFTEGCRSDGQCEGHREHSRGRPDAGGSRRPSGSPHRLPGV